MKYIKNGKLVLNGTMMACELEEKLLRALEIIIDKDVNISDLRCAIATKFQLTEKEYDFDDYESDYECYGITGTLLTKDEFELLMEVI